MANENEPAKLLLPYLRRADELQKHEPLVAYYCRLYAIERGLKISQSERIKTTSALLVPIMKHPYLIGRLYEMERGLKISRSEPIKTTSALLVPIMKQLEKDKESLQLGPDDHLHLEGFASSVFAKADKQDRAGRADRNTAKTFYAASIFFEILNQFGEVHPDLEQKQKYAAWKAADISKAIKEGRKPLPGPRGGDKDPSVVWVRGILLSIRWKGMVVYLSTRRSCFSVGRGVVVRPSQRPWRVGPVLENFRERRGAKAHCFTMRRFNRRMIFLSHLPYFVKYSDILKYFKTVGDVRRITFWQHDETFLSGRCCVVEMESFQVALQRSFTFLLC